MLYDSTTVYLNFESSILMFLSKCWSGGQCARKFLELNCRDVALPDNSFCAGYSMFYELFPIGTGFPNRLKCLN